MPITNEQLLVEIDNLIRTMPNEDDLRRATEEAVQWMGQARAIMALWKSDVARHEFKLELNSLVTSIHPGLGHGHYTQLQVILRQAANALRMETSAPLSVAVGKEMVFDYHDSLRKIIEAAKADILFVDPYLDTEFVSNYLPYVSDGVAVRLLTSKKLKTLVPGARAFAKQHGTDIDIRSRTDLHDRFVFIDRATCYQSGASFKDGAKNAPTTMTQIIDTFDVMHETYEGFWDNAEVVETS